MSSLDEDEDLMTEVAMSDMDAKPSTSEAAPKMRLALSAPASRKASRAPSPVLGNSRLSISAPVSPRGRRAGSLFLKPVATSPSRRIRKHAFAASFGSAPRFPTQSTLCPVHSFSTLETFKPKHGAVPFGSAARSNNSESLPSVHAYEDPKSTLSRVGTPAFARDSAARVSAEVNSGPAVHAYEDAKSTLNRAGTPAFTRFRAARTSADANSGPEVHCYQPTTSMLSRKGGVIARDTALLRRPLVGSASIHTHSYQQQGPMKTLNTSATFAKFGRPQTAAAPACAVHSYGEPTSTLRRSGVAPFGGSSRSTGALLRAQSTPKLGAVAKLRTAAGARPRSPADIEDPLQGEVERLRPAPRPEVLLVEEA